MTNKNSEAGKKSDNKPVEASSDVNANKLNDDKASIKSDDSSGKATSSQTASSQVKPSKVSAAKNTSYKTSTKTSTKSVSKTPVSKIAVLSLLLALVAIAGLVVGYLTIQKQQSIVVAALKKENNDTLKDYQERFKKGLKAQQVDFNQQIEQTATSLNSSIEASRKRELSALIANVERLQKSVEKQQPADWLIHEAEYLIRIASRSLWMEKDTTATINLLNDADSRLVELNAPSLLPVRQLIHEDIKALEAMPHLNTDEVVLSLMALSKGIAKLPLNFENLSQEEQVEESLALSDNVSDWQTNLYKSWQKFFNDFIRVRHRTGDIEPLMSPQQQVNLKQNLALKVQLAIWAASQRKSELYSEALIDIQLWLNTYFDMTEPSNKKFLTDILELKEKRVNYNYPTDLTALTGIRKVLKERTLLLEPSSKIVPELEVVQENNSKKKDVKEQDKAKATKEEGSALPLENAIKESDKTDLEHDHPQVSAIDEATL
ncbi:MAG: uroporphyrinogen-III C-methyltransferase [Colwellia sp.]